MMTRIKIKEWSRRKKIGVGQHRKSFRAVSDQRKTGFLLRTHGENMGVGVLISFSTLNQIYLLLIVLFFRFFVNLQFFQRGLQHEKNNLDFPELSLQIKPYMFLMVDFRIYTKPDLRNIPEPGEYVSCYSCWGKLVNLLTFIPTNTLNLQSCRDVVG